MSGTDGGFKIISRPNTAPAAAGGFKVISRPPTPAAPAATPAPAAAGGFKVISRPSTPATPAAPATPPDLTNAPSLYDQFSHELERSLYGGAADTMDTMNMLGNEVVGPAPPNTGSPADVANWLRAHEVKTEGVAKTNMGAYAQKAGAIAGSLPPGVVNWFLGVPFAAAHGWHTAQEQAAALGQTATTGQKVHYAVVEGVSRALLGKVSALQIGKLTKSLIFGSVSGGESAAEGDTAQDSTINGAVNFALGMIVPELSTTERARVQVAQDAAARGDVKGSMAHLRPVIMAHSEAISKAARQFVEPLPPKPEPQYTSGDPRLKAPPPEKAAKPAPPGKELAVPAKDVSTHLNQGHIGKELDENAKYTPLERAVVEKTAGADLALRITQREYSDSLTRSRISDYEKVFHGVPDDDRISMIASYQRDGIGAVPEAYRPAFTAGEGLLSDAYKSANFLGMETEFRKNYLPGMYRDKTAAEGFFAKLFGNSGASRGAPAGMGKPYFTHEKVFGDYEEARAAGLQPKTTNPATFIAWRVEAQNMAMSRVLAMQDFAKDGLAKQIADLSDEGRVWNPGSPFGPQPAEYANAVTMDVGGKRYLVQKDAARMFKQAFNMDAANLGEILGLDQNGLPMKAAGFLGKSWMSVRNISIPAKLAFSGFHAMHVMFIDMAQPLSSAFTQLANRRLSVGGFIKAMTDQSDRGSFAYGKHLQELFSRPYDALSEDDRTLLNIMIAGGFNPAAPGMYEVRAQETMRRAMNDEIPTLLQQFKGDKIDRLSMLGGVTRETIDAGLAKYSTLIEHIQGPLFKDWIPSVKAAAYMNQAKLLLSSRPELLAGTPEANAAMRIALRDVAKSIDNRFGMMQMDKIFFSNTLKRGLMGSVLSVGWNLGFLREFVWGPGTSEGFVPDTLKAVRDATPGLRKPGMKSEITSRMVYASTYIFGATMMAGLMTYLLTGTPPNKPVDWIYPRMPDGSRLQTMNFTREFGAFYYHAKQDGLLGAAADWFESKAVPLGSSLSEVLHNRDYFGQQVYDENASWPEQVAQSMEHMWSGGFVPISLSQKVKGQPQSPSQMLLALGGFTRAPGYVEEPGIQAAIQTAYRNLHPDDVTAYGDEPRHDLLRVARTFYQNYKQTGDPQQYAGFESTIEQYAKLYPYAVGKGGGELKKQIKSWNDPPEAQEFQGLDAGTQTAILKSASPADFQLYLRFAHPAVRAAFEKAGGQVSPTPAPAKGVNGFKVISRPPAQQGG
jgi:hypothetical protein